MIHDNYIFLITLGLHCNATWDTIMCWPATEAGGTAKLPCPPLNGLDQTSKYIILSEHKDHQIRFSLFYRNDLVTHQCILPVYMPFQSIFIKSHKITHGLVENKLVVLQYTFKNYVLLQYTLKSVLVGQHINHIC